MPETPSQTVDSAQVTRTQTGEIVTGTPPTETQTSSTTTNSQTPPNNQTTNQQTPPKTDGEGSTFLTEGDTKTEPKEPPKKEGEEEPKGAPEKYEVFKAPEGYEFTADGLTEVNGVFKELNLSQEQGQRLMDMYGKNMLDAAEAPYNLYLDTRKTWREEIASDPIIGSGHQAEVKADIGRAIATLPPEVGAAFRKAMDVTGVGDHPDFVRGFNIFAKAINEGKPVKGANPSPLGQDRPNQQAPTAAQAIYPHLSSNQPRQ